MPSCACPPLADDRVLRQASALSGRSRLGSNASGCRRVGDDPSGVWLLPTSPKAAALGKSDPWIRRRLKPQWQVGSVDPTSSKAAALDKSDPWIRRRRDSSGEEFRRLPSAPSSPNWPGHANAAVASGRGAPRLRPPLSRHAVAPCATASWDRVAGRSFATCARGAARPPPGNLATCPSSGCGGRARACRGAPDRRYRLRPQGCRSEENASGRRGPRLVLS